MKEDLPNLDGYNITEMFSSWSNQAGFPLLLVNRDYDNNSITIAQERYLTKYPNNESNLTKWWIPFNFDTAHHVVEKDTSAVDWLSQDEETKVIKPSKNHSWSSHCWVLFNKQQTGYYRVLYDLKNYQLLSKELNSGNINKIHPLSRSQLLDDLRDFTKTERLSHKILFDILPYLRRETEYAPWIAARRAIEYIRDALAEDSDGYKKFKEFVTLAVATFYKRNSISVEAGEPHLKNYLREVATSLACGFDLPLCLQQSHDLLSKAITKGEFASQNNRILIYQNGIRSADGDLISKIWDRLKKLSDSEERNEILSSFGNIADKKALDAYLKEMWGENKVFMSNREREIFVASIARGSEYGLKQIIESLTNNFDEAKNNLDINSILIVLVNKINSDEQRKQVRTMSSLNASKSLTFFIHFV